MTNHLESFNGILKQKFIAQWEKAGHHLRFDVFIHHLVCKILPQIFARRRLLVHYGLWVDERFRVAAGGNHLYSIKKKTNAQALPTGCLPIPLTWFEVDEHRSREAEVILHQKKLVIMPTRRPYEIWATCATSAAIDLSNPSYPRYNLSIHPSGSATCSCADWMKRGGVCKHLRALKQILLHWMHTSHLATTRPHSFHFASTAQEAEEIDVCNKSWYGQHYSNLVTMCTNMNKPCNSIAEHEPPLGPPSLIPDLPMRHALENHTLFQTYAGDKAALDLDEDLRKEDEEDEANLNSPESMDDEDASDAPDIVSFMFSKNSA